MQQSLRLCVLIVAVTSNNKMRKGLEHGLNNIDRGLHRGLNQPYKGLVAMNVIRWDTDALLYISYVETSGKTTLPMKFKIAINQFVLNGKGHGWWYELDAMWPFIGGTIEAHRFNLKDPTKYKATMNGIYSTDATNHGPYGVKNGGNASNWVNANYNFSTQAVKFTRNDGSHGCYRSVRTGPGSCFDMGFFNGTYETIQGHSFGGSDTFSVYAVNDGQINGTYKNNGLQIAARTASNAQANWFNGVQIDTNTSASIALPNGTLGVGTFNNNGSGGNGVHNGWVNSFFIGSSKMTGLSFYQDLELLQVALGRSAFVNE